MVLLLAGDKIMRMEEPRFEILVILHKSLHDDTIPVSLNLIQRLSVLVVIGIMTYMIQFLRILHLQFLMLYKYRLVDHIAVRLKMMVLSNVGD